MSQTQLSNPLLETSTLFDLAVPFDKIQTADFMPAVEKSIEHAKLNIERIRTLAEPATFENTIVALETAGELSDLITTVFANLEIANGDPEMNALAQKIYPAVTALASDVSLDPVLFERVQSVYKTLDQKPYTAEQKTLLKKTYKSFVRNGALLSAQQKEQVRKIDQELSVLAPRFTENVLKATNAFEMLLESKEELTGLPDSALEAAAHAAAQKGHTGKWLFNLQFPSFMPFMTYASHRPLREKMWKAFGGRAYKGEFDNQEVVLKTVQLRNERAKILGFKTHADFVLDERMAKDPQTVLKFLERLKTASKQAAERDLSEVKKFAEETDKLTEFQPWDFTYYAEKLKEKKYSFNDEELRPYFKLENVVSGAFTHAEKLFGLEFKENSQLPVYHPEVKVYEVYEAQSKKYMGLFYTDFFPRETKKGGAWMTQFRGQGLFAGEIRRPHVSIVCNFTKPTPTKPSLLSYDEVRTLFHEFGHALHGMLSDVNYRSLGGPNVFWDFVELPSQIMENWTAEEESLKIFAKHFETGAVMPMELIQKLKASQKYLAGWFSIRQVQFAWMDMHWHTADPSQIKDVDAFEDQATAETRLFPRTSGVNSSVAFSHIFAGGYDAGYYSYKWAEVLDADAFEFFKEKGLFNEQVANSFKDHILSKGGSEHPMELYKKFRGREPDADALLRRDGLI